MEGLWKAEELLQLQLQLFILFQESIFGAQPLDIEQVNNYILI
jgi:hypothetical protein